MTYREKNEIEIELLEKLVEDASELGCVGEDCYTMIKACLNAKCQFRVEYGNEFMHWNREVR